MTSASNRPARLVPSQDIIGPKDPRQSDAPGAPFHAGMQLQYLESVIKDWRNQQGTATAEARAPSGPEAKAAEKAPAAFKPPVDIQISTVIKSCVAVAVALMLGWAPVQRLLATTSAEAVVNARVVTVRTPIDGEVQMALAATDIGSQFRTNDEILTVRNTRADSSRLAGLRRDRDQLQTTIAALEERRQLLTANLAELTAQQERFRVGRVAQLEQRVREADADIASAEAQEQVASDALARYASLRKTDAVSQAALDKATGEERVARQAVLAIKERRKGMLVELDAAKGGTYIGDSYNDTPQSAQRKMEVALDLTDVRARLDGSKAQLASIEADIAEEARRFDQQSTAMIRSAVNGRVWEMLTAPGEHVNAGQDLLKLLDCGSAMVTASVSETAYQKLSLGQHATFRPRDGGETLQGWVTGLNGVAAVDSNSAIQQNALAREPYHVTLKFPGLAGSGDCRIGRTGLVQFDTANAIDAAAASR